MNPVSSRQDGVSFLRRGNPQRPRRPLIRPDELLPGAPVATPGLARPLTRTEFKMLSSWHPDLPIRDVIAFRIRSGTGFFGLIQGGLS